MAAKRATPPPLTGRAKVKAYFRKSGLAYTLALITFSTSFGHLVDVFTRFGARGWERFTGAGSIDLFIFYMAQQMRQDKEQRDAAMRDGIVIKRRTVTYPLLCVMFGICLTIAGNWLDGGHSLQSHVKNIIPPVLMLLVTFGMDRREAMTEKAAKAVPVATGASVPATAVPGTDAGTGTGYPRQRLGQVLGTGSGTGTGGAGAGTPPSRPGAEVNLRPHTGDPVGDAAPGTGNVLWMPPPIDTSGIHGVDEIVGRLAKAAVEFGARNGMAMRWDDARKVLGCQRRKAGEYLKLAEPEIGRLTRLAAARPAVAEITQGSPAGTAVAK